MSSGDSRKRSTPSGRARKIAVPTTRRTSASPTTSTASRPVVARLLADLGAVLGALRCRWYVFGAQAAVAYGRPRMTADVDVTVELGSTTPGTLLRALAVAGIEPRLPLSDAFIAEANLFPLVHAESTIPVDLLIAGSGVHADFLDRRREVDVGGVLVPLLSPEDLVITKVLAGRRKDLEDIRGILEEQGATIDDGQIRHILAAAEAALARPGLVRRFERLRKQARPRP